MTAEISSSRHAVERQLEMRTVMVPGEPSGPGSRENPALAELREYLLTELRAARSAALDTGANPAGLSADLDERIRKVRRMLAALDAVEPDREPDTEG